VASIHHDRIEYRLSRRTTLCNSLAWFPEAVKLRSLGWERFQLTAGNRQTANRKNGEITIDGEVIDENKARGNFIFNGRWRGTAQPIAIWTLLQ
jgi:hypothetical protein